MLKAIFSFIIFSWLIYLSWFFLFTNNAEDRIKNLKLEEIVRTHFNQNEQETADQFLKFAESKDIETNTSLTKSLKKLGAENFSIKENELMPQMKYITYSFDYKDYSIKIGSNVAERNLLRRDYPGPLSKLIFIDTLKCSKNQNEKTTNMVDLDNITSLGIMSSFYTDPKLKALDDIVGYICPK